MINQPTETSIPPADRTEEESRLEYLSRLIGILLPPETSLVRASHYGNQMKNRSLAYFTVAGKSIQEYHVEKTFPLHTADFDGMEQWRVISALVVHLNQVVKEFYLGGTSIEDLN